VRAKWPHQIGQLLIRSPLVRTLIELDVVANVQVKLAFANIIRAKVILLLEQHCICTFTDERYMFLNVSPSANFYHTNPSLSVRALTQEVAEFRKFAVGVKRKNMILLCLLRISF
jgi:hypothetical protein